MNAAERQLLTELSQRGRGYGLGLHQRLADRGQRQLFCLIHPRLRRLERSGFLRSWEAATLARGGRPRRYYEITSAGVAALEERRP